MGRTVGIDLGTTNSVVAVLDGAEPRVLEPEGSTRPEMPSVVSHARRRAKGGGEPGFDELVGEAAYENYPMAPEDTVYSVKRLIGRGYDDDAVQRVVRDRARFTFKVVKPADGTGDSVRVVLSGRECSPVEISAKILRKLKADAEKQLGEEVTHAVITVPAYFAEAQKRATREAGRRAGLNVIKILDEPTAAAVAYGVDKVQEPTVILVFDLGGGTFDISVLMVSGNVFVPLDLEGDMWLGGDDFDQVLVNHVVTEARKEFDVDPTADKKFMAKLRVAARSAKERLSSAPTARIIVPGTLKDAEGEVVDVAVEVTQAWYLAQVAPLIARALALTATAIERSNLTDGVDTVILAGNATRMPAVQQALEAKFGKDKVKRKVHPKHSVALGAAIAAARLGASLVCQAPAPTPDNAKAECGHVNREGATVCGKCGAPLSVAEAEATEDGAPGTGIQIVTTLPMAYGVQTSGDRLTVFFNKGDAVDPMRQNWRSEVFRTAFPGQRIVSVPVYGGDNVGKASANEKQGEALALLPPNQPEDTEVVIRLTVDTDGIFDLRAADHNAAELPHRIIKGEADAKAIEALEAVGVKLHQAKSKMPHAQVAALEAVRDEVFVAWTQGRHTEAYEAAVELQEQIDKLMRSEEPPMFGYAEFVCRQYGRALDPSKVYQLTRLVEEGREAHAAGNAEGVEAKMRQIDKETDNLPPIVLALLNSRGAIGRIARHNPGVGGDLNAELQAIEPDILTGKPGAEMRLVALVQRIKTELDKLPPPPPEQPCVACGAPLAGNRKCPKCGNDSYQVKGDQ